MLPAPPPLWQALRLQSAELRRFYFSTISRLFSSWHQQEVRADGELQQPPRSLPALPFERLYLHWCS